MATAPTLELRSLPEGSAVAVYVTAPSDSVKLRVIRRPDRAPSSEVDVGPGVVLFDDETYLLRYDGLRRGLTDFGTVDDPILNDQEYFYGAFSQDNDGVWSSGATDSTTPSDRITFLAINAEEIVQQRLEEKILRLLESNRFALRKEMLPQGIRVIDAYPFEGGPKWPVVSVHTEKDTYEEAFLGQAAEPTVEEFDDHCDENRVGVFDVELAIVCWSQNSTERRQLAKLMKAAFYEDLRFYERVGLQQLRIVGPVDAEDFSLGFPIYNVVISLSCRVPAQTVVRTEDKIESVESEYLLTPVYSGTASSGTDADSVVDSTRDWIANQWAVGFGGSAGHLVRMTTGNAAGQQRVIDSNTATELSIAAGEEFDPAPQAGDTYQILRIEEPQGTAVEYQTL
jgi:hypothetical protein